MTELDKKCVEVTTFGHVKTPYHLSTDTEGRMLVADCYGDRILLLSNTLRPEPDLFDGNAHEKLLWPERLDYNELTSKLCILHSTRESFGWRSAEKISVYNLQ